MGIIVECQRVIIMPFLGLIKVISLVKHIFNSYLQDVYFNMQAVGERNASVWCDYQASI